MKISKKEVINVVKLARIDIEEGALDKFAGQIGKILEYIDTLNNVDTTGVKPTSHAISLTNALREDELKESINRDDALYNAPEKEDGFFVVPKVIE
ncbi:MAG: Asp-tRNA(Asn)/Glu-tRNA(Gln) amidotransferase subunit GatC [Desulfobacterales bacterium]|jgi:aspartyl-tRNA(Asn)/glutamyl-tRNA(Gln) amidotransferase subunit C|nr:Asp-tRNA(Asn)/Glu-tRNA(Gln) amidotransferase subunit GatC [Desulfobacteraceae bacterium]MBT4363806.1 Asp-tRNA(Asn)/Glu-tRNA(Gln) amidotransferase subunit GatC [Desulfobacteraceae bacterium]MBT7084795.1 Asp-tRNA(Asn)/Glu-tRNA(Gln) amidotransferase subunit GatC [Desulfobacterales bacterium]MBT7698338.1 Asp-tRNA(Asn)/Glu-tRNA(Gln) amidotransferase subunit GatC [Desulfobacterales bacterium]